jgi:hypothetical protein
MDLEVKFSAMPSWGLSTAGDRELSVGPLKAFAETKPDLSVTVIPETAVPLGTATRRLHVQENAQAFDLVYYEFAGLRGVWHERGRNWILWSQNLNRFFISRGPQSEAQVWVHVRFILRHFIVSRLLAAPGYRRSHAVAGSLSAQPGMGLLIAGPYLAGKTHLIESLMALGVIDELVEDDCAVLDPQWQLAALIPRAESLCRTRHLPIHMLVCLDPQATQIEEFAAPEAAAWAIRLQASWPLSWLPGAVPVHSDLPLVPSQLVAWRAPLRPEVTAIARLIQASLAQLLPTSRDPRVN